MKTKPILLLIILISAFSKQILAQKTFQINITGLSGKVVDNMALTPDGGCIIAGSGSGGSGFYGIFLTSIDAKGNNRWSKSFQTAGGRLYISGFSGTNDNGCIAALYSLDHMIIIKCDSSGNIEWNTQVVSYTDKNLYGGVITQAKDGGYFITGGTYIDDEPSKLILYKLNNRGELLWNKAYAYTGHEFFYFAALGEAPDGGPIFSVTNIGCDYTCIHGDVHRFDKNGNFRSGKHATIGGTGGYEIKLIASDQKSIHFLLTTGRYELYPYNFCYLKFDPDNLKPKAFLIPPDLFSLQYFLRKHSIDVFNGKALPYANTHSPFYAIKKNWGIIEAFDYYPASHIELRQYDKMGRICPDYRLPAVNETFLPVDVIWHPLVLSPVYDSLILSGVDITVTPVDNVTQICAGNADAISETASAEADNKSTADKTKAFNVNIYPNPATDYLTLQITSPANLSLQIDIMQADGKVVNRLQTGVSAGVNTKPVNIQPLHKGIYFLVVKGKGVLKRVKFVKE